MKKTKQGVRDLNNLGSKPKPRKRQECEPGTHVWGPAKWQWDGTSRQCVYCPVVDFESRSDDDGWW